MTVDDLRDERFVAMRSGYLMYRFAHRLFGTDLPTDWHTTDGAEMGKVMVADGLGLTVLPDYSVVGDPLERAGLIVTRPIAGDRTLVRLSLQQRRQRRVPEAVTGLVAEFRVLTGDATTGRPPATAGRATAAPVRPGVRRSTELGLDRPEDVAVDLVRAEALDHAVPLQGRGAPTSSAGPAAA